MRWLVDECVAAALVDQLRTAGHDASYVADGGPGTIDASVLRLAHEEGRLAQTEDNDFGDLVCRARMPVPGVVLLRLAPQQSSIRWPRLAAAIEKFGEGLFGRYVVIEEKRFRSRPLLRSLSR
jgi:predicted nuclease of predicted toxin-antitoxin system